jgi:hypothetical protein
MEEIEWMLIKTENDYFPKEFPDNYPFGKDIDMICNPKHLSLLDGKICAFMDMHVGQDYNYRKVEKGKGHVLYRFELEQCLVLQIDVACADEYLQETFVSKSLAYRIERNGYYIPTMRDEIVYRMAEYCRYPHKEKHLNYIKEHIEYLDRGYLKQNISGRYLEKVEQCLNLLELCGEA